MALSGNCTLSFEFAFGYFVGGILVRNTHNYGFFSYQGDFTMKKCSFHVIIDGCFIKSRNSIIKILDYENMIDKQICICNAQNNFYFLNIKIIRLPSTPHTFSIFTYKMQSNSFPLKAWQNTF